MTTHAPQPASPTPSQWRFSTTSHPAPWQNIHSIAFPDQGLLQTEGEPGATEVIIDAFYIFNPGESYQLWLQARNSRGSSSPGPKQPYTP